MTVLVGVRCRDGVVIGADTAVTYGPAPGVNTLEVPQGFKVTLLQNDQIVVATTGEVGLGQRVRNLIERRWADLRQVVTKGNPVDTVTELAGAVHADFLKTRTGWDRGWGLGGLLGIPIGGEARLVWFDGVHFRPELVGERQGDRFRTLPIVTMGSGQPQADPFLAHAYRTLFGDTYFPSVSEGRLLVAWTLEHVIRTNVGSVGGELDIAVLEKTGHGQFKATMWDAGEAHGQVKEIERYIGEIPRRMAEAAQAAKGIEERLAEPSATIAAPGAAPANDAGDRVKML